LRPKRYNMEGKELKLTDDRVETICSMLREGYSRKKCAEAVHITRQTFHNWYMTNPTFAGKVDEAEKEYQVWKFEGIKRDCLDSLKTLICGTEYDEVTTEMRQDANGKPYEFKKVVHKKVLPNVTAVIFALCNRDPQNWQNKVTGEIKEEVKSTNINGSLSLEKVPTDVLAKVIEFMK